MLSTKMLPAVGVLVPIYLLARDAGLLDSRIGLIIIYMLINLPIAVWMLFTFFRETPKGDHRGQPHRRRRRAAGDRSTCCCRWRGRGSPRPPCSTSSSAGTRRSGASICRRTTAAPLTAFIASFSAPQGLFWAKLSAASVLAIAPILVFGWISQRQLVRGLTFGAVK